MGSVSISLHAFERFGIDVERIRRGHYTDQYFNNVRRVLETLAGEGVCYRGTSPPALAGIDLSGVSVGDLEVDVQVFTRREPMSIAAGVECALAIIASCTGHFDEGGAFVNTADRLHVRAVLDGARLPPWLPALRIAGRYTEFGILETVLLGVLTRSTHIATNTYELLQAGGGKPIFFFPARFDLYHTQPFDGLAYEIGVNAYNRDFDADVPVLLSTDAQGSFMGRRATGTMSHSYLLCFLRDTAEAAVHFARTLPPEVKRVALVDVNNDCVGDTRRTALRLFEEYRRRVEAGQTGEAMRYVLFGVRADTSESLRDVSVPPQADTRRDHGVCPELIRRLREALDALADDPSISAAWRSRARDYFRNVKILASGGFTRDKVAGFYRESVPVDMYGIGSWFFRGGCNDFTADVVRVRIGDCWHDLAKVGRQARDNPDLEEVAFEPDKR